MRYIGNQYKQQYDVRGFRNLYQETDGNVVVFPIRLELRDLDGFGD